MTATVLQRLLKYPHRAVFDTDAHAEPVLRLRGETGMAWQVADEVLIIQAGDRALRYDLAAMTVGQLAASLAADGLEVGPIAAEFAGLSATVLVEGAGDQAQSNGDRLQGFTSLLWSLYSAYGRELRQAGDQVRQALRQMVIPQAEGEWLELWANLYGVEKLKNETDAHLAERIPKEAFRIRVNALAIEQAIKDATGKDVIIEEPWEFLFRLDESVLSGNAKFYDGRTVGYHLLRPVSKRSIDWSDVLPVIHRNRAAGVLVLQPEARIGSEIDARIDGTVSFGATVYTGAVLPLWTDSRLDYMKLSAEEITRNWDVTISQVLSLVNIDPLLNPAGISAHRSIAMASIALSEGPALGDENAVLPRAKLTQAGSHMTLSDDAELSSPDQRPVWKPVDRITTEVHARGELVLDTPIAVVGQGSELRAAFVDGSVAAVVDVGAMVSAGFSEQAPAPERVYALASTVTGATWETAGGWGEFPWGQNLAQMELLFRAGDDLWTYAHYTLPEDYFGTSLLDAQLTEASAEAAQQYATTQLPEDLQ